MKLIIDINEEEYEDILNGIEHARIAGVPIGILYQAIENGIPLDDIKAEIREETECIYDECIGEKCPSNTDCMIMGEHAIEIIDRHIGERSSE